MKKLSIFFIALMFVLCGSAASWGSTTVSVPLIVVDGSPADILNAVMFEILDLTDGNYFLGRAIEGKFYSFIDENDIKDDIQITFKAGDVIDFALSETGIETEDFVSLGENNGFATLTGNTYTKPGDTPILPTWVNEWYSVARIKFEGYGSVEIISATVDKNGVSPVPIPATALLFCSSILGIVGIRRKMSK